MPKLIDTGLSKYYVNIVSEDQEEKKEEEIEVNQQELLDQLILDNLNMQAQIDDLIMSSLG